MVFVAIWSVLCGESRGLGQCVERWRPVVGSMGTTGPVTAGTVFDDGRGEALYFGGHFPAVMNGAAENVVRWDGRAWEGLGSFWTTVQSLQEYKGTLLGAGEFHADVLGYASGVAAWRLGR